MSVCPEFFAETLENLRWRENQLVTNHFGDRVWLKPCIQDGKRIGITECCFANEPCARHAQQTGESLK